MTGSIFSHLRACQQLVQWLLSRSRFGVTGSDNAVLGFALEVYAYLVLANNITPSAATGNRLLPVDTLLTSLETLSVYDTFGIMFAGIHGLFEIIPQISQLYQRILEETAETGGCSMESNVIYATLHTRIISWKLADAIGAALACQREIMAECYRHGLLIYIETAMSGPIVDDPSVICKIQDHVDAIFSYSATLRQAESQYRAILLWPLMISGSCTVKEDQRKILATSLRMSRYQMRLCQIACELLELLWRDPDKRAYGPYGLLLIMQKYNISYCMA
jgi:hypothetical protein